MSTISPRWRRKPSARNTVLRLAAPEQRVLHRQHPLLQPRHRLGQRRLAVRALLELRAVDHPHVTVASIRWYFGGSDRLSTAPLRYRLTPHVLLLRHVLDSQHLAHAAPPALR